MRRDGAVCSAQGPAEGIRRVGKRRLGDLVRRVRDGLLRRLDRLRRLGGLRLGGSGCRLGDDALRLLGNRLRGRREADDLCRVVGVRGGGRVLGRLRGAGVGGRLSGRGGLAGVGGNVGSGTLAINVWVLRVFGHEVLLPSDASFAPEPERILRSS
ncbi:hypothetical protein KIV56_05115 [Cryobacterium breve]|uniref:Uncharacterized protein n=1 Tax=Cryobacterium breve TaxID=1259258 RepID=A0ABY7NGI0_9MICO|nr:hypothetical protein [Cryobacterium breve]WBM81649.1 hypothetical protein KIV56_05115 [Cryobacterium breve]